MKMSDSVVRGSPDIYFSVGVQGRYAIGGHNQPAKGRVARTDKYTLEAQRERKRSVEWISFGQPFHAEFGLDLWLCVNEAETVSFISFLCQSLFTPLHCAQSQVNKEMDYIELL